MARARPSFPPDPLDRLVGQAPPLQALRAQIRHLATFDAVGHAAVPTILLQGETGTGKGLVARVIHDSGPRAQGPFIEINCAAIPDTLLEAELFGVEAGAFTDAKRAKPGLFETASGGTLFLDEIDALPLALQGKCLTTIEAKRVRRVGAVIEHPMDVKVIAATQVALGTRVEAGQFRADLYHRLAVVVLDLPPLRMRGEDILVLARLFLQRYGVAYGVGPQRLSQAAEAWLLGQPWPGNVRELSHLLERVALLETAMVIDPESLVRLCLTTSGPDASAVSRRTSTAGAPPHERERLAEALRQSGGNITAAARRLGMSRGGLRHRLHTYGLTRPSRHQASPSIRQDSTARETPTPGAAHSSAVPARGVEPPVVPAFQRGEGQGAGAAGRRDEQPVGVTHGTSLEPSMGWVPKPVAVLALEVTWPAIWEAKGRPYEPWTVANRWSEIIAEKVQGFGGIMLQDSPALCMVAFGLPKTLEQLPQRAVQAALAIRHLADETHPFTGEMPSPAVRLAVHLGTLLVAEGTGEPSWRWLAVGETLALPVRLLGHAVMGEILVSSEVGRLVEGWCECQLHAGPVGIETLLVRGLKPQPSPLRLHGGRQLSRFVGRERELATLSALLTEAIEGRGQVVGIVGEPGIGKSRLLYEFHQHLRAQSIPSVEGQCLSYGQAIPFGPVLDLLRHHSGITEADAPEAVAAKVQLTLQTAGIDPDEAAPYVFQLLGLPVSGDRLANLSPEMRKIRTFETLRQIYLANSQQCPLVLAVENLHWIDPTSEAFLMSLIEYLAGMRLFVLLTYRPGYRPPWIDKSYTTQMVLPPLSARDSQRMLGSILPTTIAEPLGQQILAKAQGNPFFLEEIVQTLVDQGALRHESGMTLPPTMQLPATVQGVLGARIDRLPADEKALLQTLAVIGHVCSRRLLMHIVAQPDAEVSPRLSNLQAAELLFEPPAAMEPTVTFKHILTQEVAYHTLSQARQRALHERTGQAIEALAGDRLAEHFSELAYHYSRSDNTQKAVVYLQRAGQQAADRSAYREAITHLTRGLELLPHRPDAQECSRQELDVQITLGHALIATKGQAAPDVEQAFTRARALCEQLGETSPLSAVLGGLRSVYEVRGELSKARELAEQMLGLAQRVQEPARLMQAYNALGQTLFHLGVFAPARAYLEQGMALDDPTRDRSGAVRFSSQIQGVNSRRYTAWTLWYLGYPEQAQQWSHEAIALARQRAHPYRVAYALYHAAVLHCLRREAPAAQARAEELIALARQQDLPLMVARGAFPRGWALAVQGQQAEGIAQMRQGMDAEGMIGRVQRPYRVAMLAGIYAQIGHTAEALRLLAEVLVLTHQYGGHFYEAEVHRLTGEVRLVQDVGEGMSGSTAPEWPKVDRHQGEETGSSPGPTEAAAWFRQALAIARQQQAKSIELRAAMSLSRLWQQQGQCAKAYQLLAPIYDWFTEGFDTADLQEAKALLETLP